MAMRSIQMTYQHRNGKALKLEKLYRQQSAEIAILLSLGFSNKHIMKQVGVSKLQIDRIVRKTEIKRKEYRDGETPVAKWVSEKARVQANKFVKPTLQLLDY